MTQFYFQFSDDPGSPAGAVALEYITLNDAIGAGMEVLALIAMKTHGAGETHVAMKITDDAGPVADVGMTIRIDVAA